MPVDGQYLSHVLAVSCYSGHISHATDILKLGTRALTPIVKPSTVAAIQDGGKILYFFYRECVPECHCTTMIV